MSDYEKVDVTFLYSEYSIPGYARNLEEDSQGAIHNNIVAGFAQAIKNNEQITTSISGEGRNKPFFVGNRNMPGSVKG